MKSFQGEPVIVSIVVPVYTGADFLDELVTAVAALRDTWSDQAGPFRIGQLILVDDAAIDGSPELTDRLCKDNDWVVALHMSRNFGQHAATVAGILHSSGDWIVTMDEDLQHPPDRIPDLLVRAVREGADVVYASPATGVHESFFRDASSKLFKRLMEKLTGNPDLRYFNSFRLVRGSVGRAVASVCGHDTYFDISLSWFTSRIDVLEMDLKDRRVINGQKSGYSVRRLFGHALRLLFSSHIRVLRAGAFLGMIILIASIIGGIALILLKLLDPQAVDVQGWTSLILAITFFGGLSVFMIGIALQYLSTLVLKAHGKPTFFLIDRSMDKVAAEFLKDCPK